MARVIFDHVTPTPDFAAFPIHLQLTTSRSSALLRLVALVPLMVALALPVLIFGARAGADVQALSAIGDNPVAAMQVAAGLAIWIAIFLWPLKRALLRLGARRQVRIEPGVLHVSDRSPFSSNDWSQPLVAYTGIAHHIRASLNGNRHELILVHPDTARNVLVCASDRISQATFERAQALLGLPEVSARSLYDRGRLAGASVPRHT